MEKSCGTVLFTVANGEVLYLLIENPYSKSFGFPKGHVEEGETEEQTAFRETWEETSIKPNVHNGFRCEVEYVMTNGVKKQVVYFLGYYSNQEPARNGEFENSNYYLLPFKKAYEKLSFINLKKIIVSADEYIKKNLDKITNNLS